MPREITSQVGVNTKLGDIAMAIFTDGTGIANQVNTRASDVWAELDHERIADPYYFQKNTPEGFEKAQILLVKKYPAIVFLEYMGNGQWNRKATLVGNIEQAIIKATYIRILNNVYGQGNNYYAEYDEKGLLMLENYKGDGVSWEGAETVKQLFWGALTIYGAAKSITANNSTAKIIYGTVGAFGGYNLTKK